MSISRRHFFSFIALSPAALLVKPSEKPHVDLAELQKSVDALQATFSQPITINVVLDGKKMAESVVPHLPGIIQRRGM